MKNHYFIFAISFLFIIFSFAQCEKEPVSDDIDTSTYIGSLTIINVPATIPIRDNDKAPHVNTHKMIFNATDYTSYDEEPKAKGTVTITSAMHQSDGTISIPVELKKADPYGGIPKDPNTPQDPWEGTAKFFSVTIYPYDSSEYGADAIWAKGGYTLDISKKVVDWNRLMNFRIKELGFDSMADDIYDIIREDKEVVTKPKE